MDPTLIELAGDFLVLSMVRVVDKVYEQILSKLVISCLDGSDLKQIKHGPDSQKNRRKDVPVEHKEIFWQLPSESKDTS